MNSVLLSVMLAFTPVDSVNTNDSALSSNVAGTHKGKVRIDFNNEVVRAHKGKIRINHDNKMVRAHKGKVRI